MSLKYLRKVTSLDEIPNLPGDAGIGSLYGSTFVNGDGSPRLVGSASDRKQFFVDPNTGVDSNSGRAWGDAFLTMGAALAAIDSGSIIRFRGKVREQLVSPVGIFDVTIIGEGNRPRHADVALAGYGHTAANTWTTPASGATAIPLLKVLHQGWRFENILFAGPANSSCVRLYRGGTPDTVDERDASHAEFYGCRFASGLNLLEISECYNVGVFGCRFHDATGYAIKYTAGGGIANPYRSVIVDNDFQGCANWIGAVAAHAFIIKGNSITEITTARLDTRTGAGHNVIVGNYFDIAAADFDDSGNIWGHATDIWSNTLLDTIETGVPA